MAVSFQCMTKSTTIKKKKSLSCNAGDGDSIPGQGTRIPLIAEQLSPLTTAGACALQQRLPYRHS